MTDSKDHKSPAEASREGLEQLDGNRKKHETTEHTAATHPLPSKFNETASEVHRGGIPGDKK